MDSRKDVTARFRIDPDLWAVFQAVAQGRDETPSQVLRQAVREYVARSYRGQDSREAAQ
jgi:predicted transcriptional regulator